MVLQSLFIGYCSSDFIYRSVKDMTELEKQEIIAEVEDSVMEDCTIACQLLTWGK
nr:MAG TPA: hypothetical protein [Caudoviricetes sp.]